MNEIIGKDNCIWFSKSVCKIEKDKVCPEDCDLKTLKFEKDEIINRMKQEEQNIHRLKKEGLFKNMEKIKDIIMGCYVLQKIISKEWNHIEPKVVDKDLEKLSNTMHTWRKH